ncbi:HD domain-containing protein, partial [Candidatus Aminicenantes bacterium AC-335-G13]|nr:HD domain-containing protein [Candidatus Aminicenantes bacterium AC-335-G13]
EIIKVFFSDSEHDLIFLRDFPATQNFVNSNFKSTYYKNKVKEIFYFFAKNCKYYYQIRIIDYSGNEVIRINNKRDGTTEIVPDSELQNKKHRYYFQETIKLRKNQIYVSPIDLNIEHGKIEIPYTPVVRLATPLFNSNGEKKGILILNMYFSRVLELLPKNMFIQTEEGNLISLNSDGSINFVKSKYKFRGSSGKLNISDVETIHYSTVEFLPGKKLVIAIFHSRFSLKIALHKLIFISVIILILFLCLIMVISYINISRFKELIGAQRAIISSLAELTEGRDPETGRHLERTRNYCVVLANQLRKNKKYRKIITDEFIEDLYEASPLHDIGKVGIPDAILLKEGKLTREEFEEMKKHVTIGKKVLQHAIDTFKLKQSFFIIGRNICAYHHEKYNGQGYPEGLKREKIPLEARIFALCDAYDAIRSKRPYKKELSHEEAIKRIKADCGKHFDPDIVDAFLKCEREFLRISETYKE